MPLFSVILLESYGASGVDSYYTSGASDMDWYVILIVFNLLFIFGPMIVGDALVISYGVIKNDQEGEFIIPKHFTLTRCSPWYALF